MKVGLAADHAGYEMKQFIVGLLESMNIATVDFGTSSTESVDYPDFIHPLAEAIEAGKVQYGIAFCGSGNGVNMVLNKHQKVRAALCWTPELAKLARQHNDANACSIPARFIDTITVANIVETFLSTDFDGGRHQKRVEKISCTSV